LIGLPSGPTWFCDDHRRGSRRGHRQLSDPARGLDTNENAIDLQVSGRTNKWGSLVAHVLEHGGEIICRPWQARNGALFSKAHFKINVRDRTITCPANKPQPFDFGTTIEFDPEDCDLARFRSAHRRITRPWTHRLDRRQ
jgi:hypothetical protein